MSATVTPLLLPIQLTEQQRRQIKEQTGQNIAVLPYDSSAAAVRCAFGGIMLRVTRGVFTPATMTQQLLDTVLRAVAGQQRPVIVDVGTGAGAVALAAAAALPDSLVFATEISAAALRCTRANRARLRLHNVRVLNGSLLTPLPGHLRGRVSVIAANVPYVPADRGSALVESLPPDTVIGPGADGLDLVRELASSAREFLATGGSLAMQLAGYQWSEFAVELRALGYDEPQLQNLTPRAPVVGRVIFRRQ